jgi:hypothetical protein
VDADGVAGLDRRALHHVAALDGLYGSHHKLLLIGSSRFRGVPRGSPRFSSSGFSRFFKVRGSANPAEPRRTLPI